MNFRNAFLAALDPYMREVALVAGDHLIETGGPGRSIYCPSNATIAMLTAMSDGRDVETSSIGYEGVTDLLPALTHVAPLTRMVVQIGGGAIMVPADRLRAQARQSPALMGLILVHAQNMAAQAEQSAACYALHPLTARLPRWLLVCADRADRSTISLTQDQMGVMAGARRKT